MKEFTGRNMVTILVCGFGVVFAVNATMATIAVRNFSGVTVANSYVASQNFNRWLEEAETQKALGWNAQVSRDEAGHLQIAAQGLPQDAAATAILRRPLGEQEIVHVDFPALAQGGGSDGHIFTSTAPIPDGRWLARLELTSGQDRLELEKRVE